jgi:hypothetical protein
MELSLIQLDREYSSDRLTPCRPLIAQIVHCSEHGQGIGSGLALSVRYPKMIYYHFLMRALGRRLTRLRSSKDD